MFPLLGSSTLAVREQRGGGVPMAELLNCRISGVRIMDLAGFYEHAKAEVPLDSLKASWLIYGDGFVQGRLRELTKRAFDIVSSGTLLLLASPLMLLTALAIKLEGPGPVFYQQERVGLRGRGFQCIKFRSMRTDAEKDGKARWATTNDDRVSRVEQVLIQSRGLVACRRRVAQNGLAVRIARHPLDPQRLEPGRQHARGGAAGHAHRAGPVLPGRAAGHRAQGRDVRDAHGRVGAVGRRHLHIVAVRIGLVIGRRLEYQIATHDIEQRRVCPAGDREYRRVGADRIGIGRSQCRDQRRIFGYRLGCPRRDHRRVAHAGRCCFALCALAAAVRRMAENGTNYGFDTIYLVWKDAEGKLKYRELAKAEPRLAGRVVLAWEPVQGQVAGRDRPALPIDRIEVLRP